MGSVIRRRLIAGGALLVVLAGAALLWHLHRARLEAALVRADPDRAVSDPALVRLALSEAPAIYRRHCASCHGRDLRGDHSRGAPDLDDGNWLFGLGDLPDIENTLDYGIRSGHPKAHNITDMPALGRIGQLSAAEVTDVVEYVYGLSHADARPEAAQRGRLIFMDKGSCYDCHGQDGTGNVDYGAPDLTGRSPWMHAGDRHSLYQSVYDGRHGLCPAWIERLSAAQLRELSVFLYLRARHAGGS